MELWRNFFSLEGGTIEFGSLSMHPVKIIMIDISSNPRFDLDLVNYRDQFRQRLHSQHGGCRAPGLYPRSSRCAFETDNAKRQHTVVQRPEHSSAAANRCFDDALRINNFVEKFPNRARRPCRRILLYLPAHRQPKWKLQPRL